MVVTGGHLSQCGGVPTINFLGNNNVIQSDCSFCVINGNGNYFFGGTFSGIKDNGTGNKVTSTANWSTSNNITSMPRVSPTREHPQVNALDAGFLLSGNSATPYTSANDLLIPCEQFNFAYQNFGLGPGCTADPTGTEITHSYVHWLSGYSGWTMQPSATGQGAGPYGKYLYLGDRIPLTKMTFLMLARCNATCQVGVTLGAASGSGGGPTTTLTFGTSWTLQTIAVDYTTGTAGVGATINAGSMSGTGVTYMDIAFMAFQPLNNDAIAAATSNVVPSVQNVLQTTYQTSSFNPCNLYWSNGPGSGTCINDATTITGKAVTFGTSTYYRTTGYNGVQWLLGTAPFAANTTSIGTIQLKAAASTPLQIQVMCGTAQTAVWSENLTVGTSYQIFQFLIPFITAATCPTGQILGINFSNNTSTVTIGAMSFEPGLVRAPSYLVTGTTNNTDLSGRLTLSSATTASYTFATGPNSGGYFNAVNCFWMPRFNIGTVQYWDTSTITQASVTTSAAVSGTFGYLCVVQN